MALYCCFTVNASRFLGATIVNFFDTSCVCQWGGVSGLRCVVDELKQMNQEGPRWNSTKSVKKQLSMALLRLWVNSVSSGRLNWARLTGILDPRNLFPQKFVRGRSAKICPSKIWRYTVIFQHRTGNDTTVSVHMHLLKEELNGWTHPLSLSFWRLWFTWKTLTSAHTLSAEILFLRLQVRQHKRELFKLHHQCINGERLSVKVLIL